MCVHDRRTGDKRCGVQQGRLLCWILSESAMVPVAAVTCSDVLGLPSTPSPRHSPADGQVVASASKRTVDCGAKFNGPVLGSPHGVVEVAEAEVEDDWRASSRFEE